MLNYAEALKYLEGVSWLGIRPGLERIEELLRRLGSPERRCRYVHVAGTNGKGSTSAMLAAMLTAAGYRTGLYTSPHLLRLTERMRIDGAEISPEELAGAVAALARAAEGMAEPCTEFELITAAALWWFAERGCDYVVLEVGMGGRLDATNVIPRPDCAVVTNIGLDHTAVLGDTVEQIAAEKAGIFKGGRAVAYDEPPSVAAVLRQAAERTGTRLEFADFSKLEPVSDSLEGQRFRYGGREYGIRLLGGHQTKNAATAICAARVLGLSEEAISRGLESAVWPARFELVSRGPDFVLDGGHNPQCVETTAAALEPGQKATTRAVSDVPADEMILDIGPKTVALYEELLGRAATVVWNGPVGAFEVEPFGEGTRALAGALASSPAFVVVGGGDSVAAVEGYGLADRMGYISTGGGASLELLEGKILPSVAALEARG